MSRLRESKVPEPRRGSVTENLEGCTRTPPGFKGKLAFCTSHANPLQAGSAYHTSPAPTPAPSPPVHLDSTLYPGMLQTYLPPQLGSVLPGIPYIFFEHLDPLSRIFLPVTGFCPCPHLYPSEQRVCPQCLSHQEGCTDLSTSGPRDHISRQPRSGKVLPEALLASSQGSTPKPRLFCMRTMYLTHYSFQRPAGIMVLFPPSLISHST